MDFYHLLNRGVDKRTVFTDNQDYTRFVRNLFVLNTDVAYAHNDWSLRIREETLPGNKLVHIHAYCLLPNHYHLLVSPLEENGIAQFMKKVNMGYSKYFNERYSRSGALWQGKYKSVQISTDAHFMYIPYYIHLNALDLSMHSWRKGNVSNIKKAYTVLNNYRWSSHRHYLDQEQSQKQQCVETKFLSEIFGTPKHYMKEIEHIISTPSIAKNSEVIEI